MLGTKNNRRKGRRNSRNNSRNKSQLSLMRRLQKRPSASNRKDSKGSKCLRSSSQLSKEKRLKILRFNRLSLTKARSQRKKFRLKRSKKRYKKSSHKQSRLKNNKKSRQRKPHNPNPDNNGPHQLIPYENFPKTLYSPPPINQVTLNCLRYNTTCKNPHRHRHQLTNQRNPALFTSTQTSTSTPTTQY